jgi:hypothetical protein
MLYMKTKSTEEELIIYKEKNIVIFWSILAGIACIAFGMFFSYGFLLKGQYLPVAFGSLFTFFGAIMLLQLPKNSRKMAKNDGFVYLKANRKGLALAPIIGLTPIDYNWSEILQILLTEKFIAKEIDGEISYRNNFLIIYFHPHHNCENTNLIQQLIQFGKDQIEESPQKHAICSIPFPKGEAETIKKELIRLSSNNDKMFIYKKIFFDYKKAIEIFEKY